MSRDSRTKSCTKFTQYSELVCSKPCVDLQHSTLPHINLLCRQALRLPGSSRASVSREYSVFLPFPPTSSAKHSPADLWWHFDQFCHICGLGIISPDVRKQGCSSDQTRDARNYTKAKSLLKPIITTLLQGPYFHQHHRVSCWRCIFQTALTSIHCEGQAQLHQAHCNFYCTCNASHILPSSVRTFFLSKTDNWKLHPRSCWWPLWLRLQFSPNLKTW